MRMLTGLRARLRALTRSSAADHELSEEIRFHIELETEKNGRLGMTPDEARRIAVAHFGGVQRVREEHHDVRRLQWVEDFIGDARFALRSLRRTPGLAGAAILTLALGIGANVAIFSAVNAVVLQPLPFVRADRLVMVTEENPEKQWHLQDAAPANYLDWRAGVPAFADAAAYADGYGRETLTGRGQPALLAVANVTGNFFSVLGIRPLLGRTFTDAETWQDASNPIVLGERVWREMFGADQSIIGKTITLDGASHTVIGVAPRSFAFPFEDLDAWTSVSWKRGDASTQSFRRAHWLRVIARLRDGVSHEQANAQLQQVAARLTHDYPGTNTYMGASMTPLHEFLVGDTRLPLLVLLAAVALLLLIACANVGNLLLVQAAGREREVALRLALGAGRSRLVRQALTESLIISVIGAAAGLAVGWAGTRALVALQPPQMLRVHDFGVDGTVLVFVVVVGLASGLIFGVAPALWTRSRGPAEALKSGGRAGTQGARMRRWRDALVVGEVALALMLTVGAGLLVRSLWAVRHVEAGFDPSGVLAVRVSLNQHYDSAAKVVAFYDQLLAQARALPSVSNAALTVGVPLEGQSWTSDFLVAGRAATAYGVDVVHRHVSPGYLETMKVPLIRGRAIETQDRIGSPRVVVINKALADSYFSGQDPVGQRIAFDRVPTPASTWYTIVGVVGSEHQNGLDAAPRIEVLHAFQQEPRGWADLAVRTTGDPAALTPQIRRIVNELDPSLALTKVRTMDDVRATSMARARFLTTLLFVFAVIGMALALVGVYSVLAQLARNRTREMGIRIALGAQAAQVRWLVVRQGLRLTAYGLVAGGVVAVFATRLMTKLLFNVAPNDPATLLGVSALLAVTSVFAAWIPARKASRADPAMALRAE